MVKLTRLRRLAFTVAVWFLCESATLFAQREARTLTEGWKFIRQDITPTAKTDTWETVTVPHTWNAADGANGLTADPQRAEGYYRGPAWYARALDVPAAWKEKRVFIRFEGAALIADVLINDIHVGQHRGAFAAFCFEITPFLRFDGKDTLKVRVNNIRAFDVAPLSGDFTVFGGIYRPVQLIATDAICISPLEFASPGVFLTVKDLKDETAGIEVRTFVSSALKSNWEKAQVEVEIKDAEGKVVASNSRELDVAPGKTETVAQPLAIPKPRRWNGRRDPYLYSATVRIKRGTKVVDEVTQPLGIRTVAITQEKGFLLNGEPYPLHGVNRHQDRAGKGWALSNEDHKKDHALIMEIGATTVRLAHYQQADAFHDLSDRAGLIEWQEIPLVDTVSGSPQFLENARQQLTEMVCQGYNHPSICLWGIYNELDARWASVKTAPAEPIIEDLTRLAKKLDPSRPTVAASWGQDPTPLHKITDWVAWNIYPGWYAGKPEDAGALIEKFSGMLDGKRIGISEYGAGANLTQFHEGELKLPRHDGPFHPQEWQNHVHEKVWAQLKDNPRLWGTWIWAMFDFASDKRNEGNIPGLNDKGLVTRDRKIKKDTFYFYKANWTEEPMVYIASRRMTPRKQAVTEVKVYSNCPEVELKVNDESVGKAKPNEVHVFRWQNVELQAGINTIEAIGSGDVKDKCEWTLESQASPTP